MLSNFSQVFANLSRCLAAMLAKKTPEFFDKSKAGYLEAQQRYFSYRAMFEQIVSQKSFVLFSKEYRAICSKMGYRTDVPV